MGGKEGLQWKWNVLYGIFCSFRGAHSKQNQSLRKGGSLLNVIPSYSEDTNIKMCFEVLFRKVEIL